MVICLAASSIEFLRKKERKPGLDWEAIFPPESFDVCFSPLSRHILPCSLQADERDLVWQMLQFNGARRISVECALQHPYLRDFHGMKERNGWAGMGLHLSDPTDEPSCENIFTFRYENSTNPALALLKEFADFHSEIKQLVQLDGSV